MKIRKFPVFILAQHPVLPFFFFFILAFTCLFSHHAKAYTGGAVTFSWRPNPPQENVQGYRLYYGTESRYHSNGTPKNNFSYEYYIDIANSLRCDISSGSPQCDPLDYNEFNCEGLNNSSPHCTLSQLDGTLYFSLTACNSADESNFTRELKAEPGTHVHTSCIMAIQNLLLDNG